MKKILLVDDHTGVLRLLAIELKLEGYDIVTAVNGKEALELIYNGSPPDLVVLDIVMPVMNGFEVLARLREYSRLPVIVHSFDESNKERALKSGADDFVLKPFDPDELLKKIRRLLNGKKPEGSS